jgi:hypothetical protein
MPLNVSAPTPSLTNAPLPPNAPARTTPLAVVKVVADVSTPSPANVNIPLFVASPNVTIPPNEIPFAIVRATVPSLATVPPKTASVPVPNALLFPMFTIPALTKTPPLNVFAPLKTSDPLPVFVNPPEPVITPLTVNADAALSFETSAAPDKETDTFAPNVNAPVPASF